MRASDLGCPTWHPEALHWRKPRVDELTNGSLHGKKFKTTRGKEFVCEKSDERYIYFYNIKMEYRFSKFLLPTVKQLTEKERIQWIHDNYDVKSFHVGQGCQLHGDVDAHLYLNDGTYHRLAWNY